MYSGLCAYEPGFLITGEIYKFEGMKSENKKISEV
jgi:hypothetical protein